MSRKKKETPTDVLKNMKEFLSDPLDEFPLFDKMWSNSEIDAHLSLEERNQLKNLLCTILTIKKPLVLIPEIIWKEQTANPVNTSFFFDYSYRLNNWSDAFFVESDDILSEDELNILKKLQILNNILLPNSIFKNSARSERVIAPWILSLSVETLLFSSINLLMGGFGKLSELTTIDKKQLDSMDETTIELLAKIKHYAQYTLSTIPTCKSMKSATPLNVVISGEINNYYFEVNNSIVRQFYYDFFERSNKVSASTTDEGKRVLSLIHDAISGFDNGEALLANMGTSDQLAFDKKTNNFIIRCGKTGQNIDIKKEDFNKLIRMGLILEVHAGSPTVIVYSPKLSYVPR